MGDLQVAVNLLWCVPGDVGGSEEYLVRQLLGLADAATRRQPTNCVPTLYVLDGFIGAHPDLADTFATIVAPFDGAQRARRIVGESTWFRQRSAVADLRHHGGGTAPIGARRPFVLTIHDLQYRTFPQNFSRRKRAYLTAMIGRSVRGAAVVAVPSQYVRGTVIDAFAADPDRVCVVPHGYEPALLADVADEGDLRRRHQLGDGPVLVYPAVTNPHKNHRFLIDLMCSTWHDPDLRLVLIGGSGPSEREIAEVTDQRIRRLGRVSPADRNGLLAMAEAMVFPSRYEGFGAPLIEAMALGCPVVAADSTCIPDVVGDAGLVLPLDDGAWADALDRVAASRAALIAAGHQRAAHFTAKASGEALAAAYCAAMGGR